MQTVAVVTDSASDLSEDLRRKHSIQVVPLTVRFGTEEHLECDLPRDEFWARANSGPTGLASMRAFQDTASELALVRKRMHHSTANRHAVEHERRLLEALVEQRRAFLGEWVG